MRCSPAAFAPRAPDPPSSLSLEIEQHEQEGCGVAHQRQGLSNAVQFHPDSLLEVQSYLGQAPRGTEIHREVVGGCHVELKLFTHSVYQFYHSWGQQGQGDVSEGS